jgi:hypothetical protein
VCYETCNKLKENCKIELDDIVLQQVGPHGIFHSLSGLFVALAVTQPLQGRCQSAPSDDGAAQAGRDKCTADAHTIKLPFWIAALPLFLLSY